MSRKWPEWLSLGLDAAAKDTDRERATLTTNALFTRFRDELRASGLCVQGCGEPKSERSAEFCERHHMLAIARGERRRTKAVEEGRCVRCYVAPRGETRLCEPCREVEKRKDAERYAANKVAGVCHRCRGAKVGKMVLCRTCREVDRRNSRDRQRDLRARGICVTCAVAETKQRRCRACADKFNAGRVAMRKKDKEQEIRDAMKLVVERDSEFLATGERYVDEEYLIAKEIVMRRAV